tara:strand:+ start:5234 stop:5803 length:570 start_codon:yes stop_codon:yes gene_type:complete
MDKPSTTGSNRSDSLQKLHKLCTELNDRDDQLKKDINLFESFFTNFPVPVTMWSIGKDHTVLSKRGNAFTCEEASTLDDIFKCPIIREQSIKKHELALEGDIVSYFVAHSSHVYWTRLIPKKNNDGSIAGVVGIAWDVTSNAIMLSSLENVVEMIESGESLDDIKQEAMRGVSSSRLKALLEDEESIGG